jgi:hypothetical protein
MMKCDDRYTYEPIITKITIKRKKKMAKAAKKASEAESYAAVLDLIRFRSRKERLCNQVHRYRQLCVKWHY